MKATARIGAVSAGVLLFVAGCSMGREEAKQGVAEFRALVAQHAFNDVYAGAGPGLQQAVTEDKFVGFMTALDRKLGAWQSAGEPAWNVTRGTNGHFVRLVYQSQFARGPAAEEFLWQVHNGRSILAGYHVNSPLLVSE